MENFASMVRAFVEVVTLKRAIKGANLVVDSLGFYETVACYEWSPWHPENGTQLRKTGDDAISEIGLPAERVLNDLLSNACYLCDNDEAFLEGWKWYQEGVEYHLQLF